MGPRLRLLLSKWLQIPSSADHVKIVQATWKATWLVPQREKMMGHVKWIIVSKGNNHLISMTSWIFKQVIPVICVMVTPYRRDGHNPYSTIYIIYVLVTQNAIDHGYDHPYNGNIIMNIDHGTYGENTTGFQPPPGNRYRIQSPPPNKCSSIEPALDQEEPSGWWIPGWCHKWPVKKNVEWFYPKMKTWKWTAETNTETLLRHSWPHRIVLLNKLRGSEHHRVDRLVVLESRHPGSHRLRQCSEGLRTFAKASGRFGHQMLPCNRDLLQTWTKMCTRAPGGPFWKPSFRLHKTDFYTSLLHSAGCKIHVSFLTLVVCLYGFSAQKWTQSLGVHHLQLFHQKDLLLPMQTWVCAWIPLALYNI